MAYLLLNSFKFSVHPAIGRLRDGSGTYYYDA